MDAQKRPLTRGAQYISLNQIKELGKLEAYKCSIKIENNKLFVDEREINSFLLNKKNVILQAQHFTSRENANKVRQTRNFSCDPEEYLFFLEEDFNQLDKKEIKHLSGAQDAEVKFEIKCSIPLYRVWLKIEKNHPVKYAIQGGLESKEIIEISVERI